MTDGFAQVEPLGTPAEEQEPRLYWRTDRNGAMPQPEPPEPVGGKQAQADADDALKEMHARQRAGLAAALRAMKARAGLRSQDDPRNCQSEPYPPETEPIPVKVAGNIQMTPVFETSRTYFFPAGDAITYRNVRWIVVRPSGNHRLKTADGKLHIVSPKWLAIQVETPSGEWTF